MGICDDQVVIVTGAGRGLGRAHALALAAAGATVVVNDLGASLGGEGTDITPAQEVVDEITASGGVAVVNGDNVADFDAAGSMVADTVARFGRLDALVCNAGIVRDRMLVYAKQTSPLIAYYSAQKKLMDFAVKKGIADLPRLKKDMGLQ